MTLNQCASAILNDLWGGNLIPLSNRSLISVEQIEDEVMEERVSIIKEWYLRNLLSKNDLAIALNCVEVDCKNPSLCPCKELKGVKSLQHFEIPPLVDGLGKDAILFIGSVDRAVSYRVFFDKTAIKYHQYRRHSDIPCVYIEKTLNENGMYDGWIFNAPFVKNIAVIGIFKDLRHLKKYNCCSSDSYDDLGSVAGEIIRRMLAKKASLYRTAVPPVTQVTS